MFDTEFVFVPRTCQWIGDNDRCDEVVIPGESYCTTHRNLCYAGGTTIQDIVSAIDKEIATTFVIEELVDGNKD